MAPRKQKTAAEKAAAAAKPKGPPRPRLPWIESHVKVGQIVAALSDLGHDIDAEVLHRAYNRRGNRKVAKINDPKWLREQLAKVTGEPMGEPEPPTDPYPDDPEVGFGDLAAIPLS